MNSYRKLTVKDAADVITSADSALIVCHTNPDGDAVGSALAVKKLFEALGYRLPSVFFWIVQSRSQQQPVKMNEQGVALISGASPGL